MASDFDDALTTVVVKKPGGTKEFEGCPCGSVVFVGGHITDESDGRVYNRCRRCGQLVRSYYTEQTIEGESICFRDEGV